MSSPSSDKPCLIDNVPLPDIRTRARDRAGGAHPYLMTPEHTEVAREALGEGPLLAPELHAVLDTDGTRARAIARDGIAMYLELPNSNYVTNWRRSGFGDDDFVDGGSDRLVDRRLFARFELDQRDPYT